MYDKTKKAGFAKLFGLEKMSSGLVKKKNIDAHAFKKVLVSNDGGMFDIARDKAPNELFLLAKMVLFKKRAIPLKVRLLVIH